jgi:hypothetical protein
VEVAIASVVGGGSAGSPLRNSHHRSPTTAVGPFSLIVGATLTVPKAILARAFARECEALPEPPGRVCSPGLTPQEPGAGIAHQHPPKRFFA